MEDLSALAAGSLAASSQAATNTVSVNHAMTAPGTVSESTAAEDAGDPHVETPEYDGRHLVSGGGDRG
jgi:hypothetical protein